MNTLICIGEPFSKSGQRLLVQGRTDSINSVAPLLQVGGLPHILDITIIKTER